jgi:hypothetical protein
MDIWFATAASISFWAVLTCLVCIRISHSQKERTRAADAQRRLQAAARALEEVSDTPTPTTTLSLVYIISEEGDVLQRDSDPAMTCVVCYDRLSISVLRPCRHTLCPPCSLRVSRCPLCRTYIVARSIMPSSRCVLPAVASASEGGVVG